MTPYYYCLCCHVFASTVYTHPNHTLRDAFFEWLPQVLIRILGKARFASRVLWVPHTHSTQAQQRRIFQRHTAYPSNAPHGP